MGSSVKRPNNSAPPDETRRIADRWLSPEDAKQSDQRLRAQYIANRVIVPGTRKVADTTDGPSPQAWLDCRDDDPDGMKPDGTLGKSHPKFLRPWPTLKLDYFTRHNKRRASVESKQ